MKYGVEYGQYYLAADGSKHGMLVVDVTTYAHCDNVVVIPFSTTGYGKSRRIDAFKLAIIWYYLAKEKPEWLLT